MLLPSWRPSPRNVVFQPKPEFVPMWVYTQALAAKRQYNENWEFWVFLVSRDHNCSQAEAEDACIRGIKQEINRFKLVYGPKVGKWFEDFMEMDDIFNKVVHPIYLPKLG